MYKSFVLKHVTEPPKLLFASFHATMVSMGVWMFSAMIAKTVLGFSFLIAFLTSIIVFLAFHGLMVILSYKDPYFLNVMMAWLRCHKTKNLAKTQHNLYGA